MGKAKDIVGQRFGHLLVIKRLPNERGHSRWLCKCDCGEQVKKSFYTLRIKTNISCGCSNRHGIPTKTLTQDVLRKIYYIDCDGHMIPYSTGKFPTLDPSGYYSISINGKQIDEHRLVWMYYHGEFPKGVIDHEDHNKGNNKIENLRDVPQKINLKNTKLSVCNTSGCTGVYWDKSRNKWSALIRVDYKTKYLGRFDVFEEAVSARKAAELIHGFHENHGK